MKERTIRTAADSAPYRPIPYEKADVSAVQALARGEASPDMQRRALDWIIKQAAGTYDLAYRPGAEEGSRDTTFALGRQFVGQQIVKLLNIAVGSIPNRDPRADPSEQS